MLKILIAFKAEAIPLIEFFDLRRSKEQNLYPVYENDQVRLIIGGQGAHNAFNATNVLTGDAGVDDHWLNFGVAGSGGFSIGDFIIARQIMDRTSGDIWNLSSVKDIGLQTVAICCVDEMQRIYHDNVVYEMESAGFLRCLNSKNLSSKAVCLKLISDGPNNVNMVTLETIKQLIKDRSSELTNIVHRLFLKRM
ncbi:MAG: hypothetical protein GKR95_07110 [Gammaproteobacteria bacterium]|nr:hypothetical protein [Gammaproteobacteria bacterium]